MPTRTPTIVPLATSGQPSAEASCSFDRAPFGIDPLVEVVRDPDGRLSRANDHVGDRLRGRHRATTTTRTPDSRAGAVPRPARPQSRATRRAAATPRRAPRATRATLCGSVMVPTARMTDATASGCAALRWMSPEAASRRSARSMTSRRGRARVRCRSAKTAAGDARGNPSARESSGMAGCDVRPNDAAGTPAIERRDETLRAVLEREFPEHAAHARSERPLRPRRNELQADTVSAVR